jgi:hypothetical protein
MTSFNFERKLINGNQSENDACFFSTKVLSVKNSQFKSKMYSDSLCDSLLTFIYKPILNPLYHWNVYITDYKELYNKYYTIIDVLYQPDTINYFFEQMYNKLYKLSKYVCYYYHFHSNPRVILKLKNDSFGDTLFYAVDNRIQPGFIFVPYFVKQKQLYERKWLFSRDGISTKDLITNEDVDISGGVNNKWYCKDITLLDVGQVDKGNKMECNYWDEINTNIFEYDNGDYAIFYILTNDKKQTIAVKCLDNFTLVDEYIKNENAQKISEAIRKQQENDAKLKKEKEIQAEQTKRNADCKRLFGEYNGELISQGKVELGMSEAMCLYAWSEPWDKTKVTNDTGVHEVWSYGYGKTLYFLNNVLIQIVE